MTAYTGNITPIALIRAALTMRLIDSKQREILLKDWCNNPHIDIADHMVGRGFLTQPQLHTIKELINNGLFLNEAEKPVLTSPNGSGKTFASDLYNEHISDGLATVVVAAPQDNEASASTINDVADFSSYVLKSSIGSGGLGVVNLYHDTTLNRDVAVKEIRREALEQSDKRQLVRFIQEAQVTGQLQHPAIVPIYELSVKPSGCPYFVMKHVQGNSMEDVLKKIAQLPTEEERFAARMKLLEPLIIVCEAVAYAHEKGVIHRDLKPANIILGKFGETVILDWGLAKYVGQEDVFDSQQDSDAVLRTAALAPVALLNDAELTHADELVGTPAYMAPEQVDENFGVVDQRSDVYALGVIFFRILTGRMPYVAENISSLLDQISQVGVPAPDPSHYYSAIPKELAAICRKAMAKNKHNRFESANELSHVLEAYRDGRTVSIYSYTPSEMLKRFVERNKLIVYASMVLVVVVVLSSMAITHLSYQSKINAQVATEAERLAINERQRTEDARQEVAAVKDRSIQRLADIPALTDDGLQEIDDIATKVQKEFLSAMRGTVDVVSSSFLDQPNETNENDLLKRAANDILTSYPQILSCAFISRNQEFISAYPDTGQQNFKIDTFPILPRFLNKVEQNNRPALSRLKADSSTVFYIAPIKKPSTSKVGFVVLTFNPDTVLKLWIERYHKNKQFYIWVMQDDGLILNDIHPEDVRSNVFYDARYAPFPDLIAMAHRFLKSSLGVGHYSYDKSDQQTTATVTQHKICTWRTLQMTDNVRWVFIATTTINEEN